jgi:hypothetical protein
MSSALIRLAHQPHADLAVQAYCRFVNLVTTGIVTEEQVRENLLQSCVSGIPANEAEATITQAFNVAKRKQL